MLSLTQRIDAFSQLGMRIQRHLSFVEDDSENFLAFNALLQNAFYANPWFTIENSRAALMEISAWLTLENLESWASKYQISSSIKQAKNVSIIMAGNIPLVGFHDYLCVLISGNKAILKMSSQDSILLTWINEQLLDCEPKFKDFIHIENHLVKNSDAVIATGSTNSSRYFEHYFSKYPSILRSHRNSIAILDGNENADDLSNLGNDIFQYFGLGCRNVSKIFVPKGYDFTHFFQSIEHFASHAQHTKYFNNYEYNKAIFLINKVKHFDNGFLLLTEDHSMHSAVGVLHYEVYEDLKTVFAKIESENSNIQCVVSKLKDFDAAILLGETQKPKIDEYADNVDTMNFLCNLNSID